MSEFKVNISTEETVIEGLSDNFRMKIRKNVKADNEDERPLLEATVYKIEGSFVPSGHYLFETVDNADQPNSNVDLLQFHEAIDFFFTSLLDTEYYLKSIPKSSIFCSKELKAFKF